MVKTWFYRTDKSLSTELKAIAKQIEKRNTSLDDIKYLKQIVSF